ncbi:hypothetical protein [Cobetia sp. ICG0124]|uniref:hypothetical protein n=1 Tax=Cobetia sp. ICG0124 TaxID=2053669 RepID=UPI001F0C8D59|nr:hypothetical protein [Cobetia sp. ICG0124]
MSGNIAEPAITQMMDVILIRRAQFGGLPAIEDRLHQPGRQLEGGHVAARQAQVAAQGTGGDTGIIISRQHPAREIHLADGAAAGPQIDGIDAGVRPHPGAIGHRDRLCRGDEMGGVEIVIGQHGRMPTAGIPDVQVAGSDGLEQGRHALYGGVITADQQREMAFALIARVATGSRFQPVMASQPGLHGQLTADVYIAPAEIDDDTARRCQSQQAFLAGQYLLHLLGGCQRQQVDLAGESIARQQLAHQ